MVKLINCSGYAQTGCTAQVHILAQYHSVEGVQKAYNEFGALKIPKSYGAVMLSELLKQDCPDREEIRRTLMGQLPEGDEEVSWSFENHVKGLAKVKQEYGEPYDGFTNEAVDMLPENLKELSFEEKFEAVKTSFRHWAHGLMTQVSPHHFDDEPMEGVERVLGLKNDPVGAHPTLTGLLPEGSISSAIIRDPRDTNVDFNRHYGIGHTEESTRNQCRIYNSQIRSSLRQIKLYKELFEGKHVIIEFERLVTEEDYRNRYVKTMVGERPKVRNKFFPEISEKNVGMYKDYDEALIAIVEEECLDNYKTFLETVKTEGLLME